MATERTEVTLTLTEEEVRALKKGLSELTRNTGAAEARYQLAILLRLKNADPAEFRSTQVSCD
jgi:hypothetical protein